MSDLAPHFYVKPTGGTPGPVTSRADGLVLTLRTGQGCVRKGCGLPPEHPVHLRPPADDTQHRATATA